MSATASPRVRPETPADHARVAALQEAAFGRPGEAELVRRLRASARPQLSLVAELGGEVVGHVFLSPVSAVAPGRLPPAAGLAPLGVDPRHQGRGAGAALVRAGLEGSRGLGWCAVFLVGSPAYYSRFGFVAAAPLGLHYGSAAFDPVFQVRELERDALRGCAGWVRYDDAFAETGTA